MNELLQNIESEISKLSPEDATGHIYWYKFLDMVLAYLKSENEK